MKRGVRCALAGRLCAAARGLMLAGVFGWLWVGVWSCAGEGTRAGGERGSNSGAGDRALATEDAWPHFAGERREAWTFEGVKGEVVSTGAYRIYLGTTAPPLPMRVGPLAETMLRAYRSSLTSEALPVPGEVLETYVLATRPQWAAMTTRLLGGSAGPFLRMQRGGFTHEARVVLHDIGAKDTLSLLAHEGWHQYTQAVFADPLPIWLDEGIAAWFEGFRWDESRGVPTVLPWANLERFDELRRVMEAGGLMPLEEFCATSPQQLVGESEARALAWYAQAWVLVHWLRDGDGGVRKGALSEVLLAAQRGTLLQRVIAERGDRAASELRLRRTGSAVFTTMIGADLSAADVSLDRFARTVTRATARNAIAEGASPIGDAE